MAEALARHLWMNGMEARSAGLEPLGHIPPLTLEVLSEAGVSTDGLHSKGLAEVRLDDVDYLVNLLGMDIDGHLPSSFAGKLITHYIRDPFGGDIDSYRDARREIESFLREKLPRLIETREKE